MDISYRINKKKACISLICGMLGCICFGSGDWLMMYGDTTHTGSLFWLTEGVKQIAGWRFNLAMLLAFPGIIFYAIALFSLENYIKEDKHKNIYHKLNIIGLTPWICLHLFYTMILFLFGWLSNNGYQNAALPACEALYAHFSWLAIVSEIIMLPPFIYWFYLQFTRKTVFSRSMAFTNILFIYGILEIVKSLMPDTAFRIGFTNGLMSESMVIWFLIMIIWTKKIELLHNNP